MGDYRKATEASAMQIISFSQTEFDPILKLMLSRLTWTQNFRDQ